MNGSCIQRVARPKPDSQGDVLAGPAYPIRAPTSIEGVIKRSLARLTRMNIPDVDYNPAPIITATFTVLIYQDGDLWYPMCKEGLLYPSDHGSRLANDAVRSAIKHFEDIAEGLSDATYTRINLQFALAVRSENGEVKRI